MEDGKLHFNEPINHPQNLDPRKGINTEQPSCWAH